MKTINTILATISQFFKSFNVKTKENTDNSENFEFTHTQFGINLKQDSSSKKTSKSLLTQMYSEENETLFI